jgi:outer membrane protein assembly factor BamB
LADVEISRLTEAGAVHSKNSYASPTPVLEADRVYVHFGSLATACLKSTGEIVWKTRLAYEQMHGPAGSPVLYRDLLILSCDGTDVQYVVALDKHTGKVRWKTARPRPGYMAYSTPLLIRAGQRDELVSPGAYRAIAYEPASGRELWHVRYGEGYSNVPRPVYAHGLVFLATGFDHPSLVAVRPGGRGDVTNSQLAWQTSRAAPLTPSPLVAGGELYMVSDNGIASCLDAQSGRVHWQQRLGANFSASPVLAGGRIYFLSEEGETTVIEPGVTFKRLAVNRLDAQTLASPAVSGGAIYIRSAGHLYRIEEAVRNP